MKTSDLTARLDAEFGCWIAFHSSTGSPWDSEIIGEGSTRESAIADYWFGVHGDKAASLLEPDHTCHQWRLHDGTFVARFDTREAAVTFAEAHQYIINPLITKL